MSFDRFARIALAVIIFTVSLPVISSETLVIPIQNFSREPEFTAIKISPDGKYVGFVVPNGNSAAIAVIRVTDKTLIGRFQMDAGNQVIDFWWANDSRIVASLATQLGSLDRPSATGELVAFDANGGNPRYLSGYRGQSSEGLGTRLGGKATRAWGASTMIDPLIDDHDNVLIAFRGFDRWEDTMQVVYRLNIYTGARTPLDGAPVSGDIRFVADHTGTVRYATAFDGKLGIRAWQHLPGNKDWQPVTLPNGVQGVIYPLAFSSDDKSVFLESTEFGPRSCLVQYVLASAERHKLACDDWSDLVQTINAFDRSEEPIAAVFEAGKPQIRLLDTGNPTTAILQQLMQAFPGKVVEPVSITRDGKKALVLTYDDRTPGDYFLFDTETRKADYFFGLRTWLDPDAMSERRPVQIKARDGTPLWGYLTLPKNLAAKNLPLLVNPHGGPFWVRDHWAFDIEPQMLANRGYAVLQVNFRGSGGYGSNFVAAGRKAWGTTMIDDITDATRWTIEQGFVDPSRICIYGASYGGFAALMSAEREPELYRCVVGYAGVYDLNLLKRDSDITDSKSGRSYFDYAIAGTAEEMTAQSPITYLDKLKAPMLIVHGEEDPRAPFSQATTLKKAMTAGKHPFEWLSRPGEGHGFWKPENVQAFNQQMLDFLERNIGASVAQAAPPSTSESSP